MRSWPLLDALARAGQHFPDASARRKVDDSLRTLAVASLLLGDLIGEERHLRSHGHGLAPRVRRSQPQLRRPLLRARAVVVAVADKDALRDRVAFDLGFFETLLSGRLSRRLAATHS